MEPVSQMEARSAYEPSSNPSPTVAYRERVVAPTPVEPDRNALLFLLRYVFGFDGFRDGQTEAIRG